MPVAHSLLSQSTISVDERQQALDRIHSDPGIPNDTTTSSFWLRTPHPQFEQPSTQALPTKADVVIIGSGITGTSIACTLLQNRKKNESASPHPFVVMLEARDICSGATGRNGGHILEKADDYADLEDSLGEDAARKIMRFRLAHLPEILQTAEEIGLTDSAQVRKVRFMSAYFSDKSWEAALERLLRFKLGMPEESAEWVAHGGDSVPEVCPTFLRLCLPLTHKPNSGTQNCQCQRSDHWPRRCSMALQICHWDDMRSSHPSPI